MAQVEYHPYITKNSPISAAAFLPTGLGVGVGGKWRTPQRSLQCQPTYRESQRTLAYCQEVGKKCFLALWSRKGGGKSKGGSITPHCPAKVQAQYPTARLGLMA